MKVKDLDIFSGVMVFVSVLLVTCVIGDAKSKWFEGLLLLVPCISHLFHQVCLNFEEELIYLKKVADTFVSRLFPLGCSGFTLTPAGNFTLHLRSPLPKFRYLQVVSGAMAIQEMCQLAKRCTAIA